MTRALVAALAAMLWLPTAAWGQAYKCKKPNGTVAFQDRPCRAGEEGAAIPLVAPPPIGTEVPGPKPEPGGKPDPRRSAEQESTQRANEAVRAHNQQVEAQNTQARCNNARRDYGVLMEQRPVYRYDNAGKRQYIEDKNRPAEIAAAQARVAADCE